MHAVTMLKELQNPRHIQYNGRIDSTNLFTILSVPFSCCLWPLPHMHHNPDFIRILYRGDIWTQMSAFFYFIYLFWSGFNLASSLILTPGEQHVWIQQKNCWSCEGGYDWHTCRIIEIPEGAEDEELYLQNDDNKSSPNWRDEEIQQLLVV